MNDIDIQQEMFAVPIRLKKRIKFDGQDIYGSNSLDRSFIKALSKAGRSKQIVSTIENLVRQQIIIPCFLQKGLSGFVTWKIFAPSDIKSIMGFFSPKQNIIVLLLDNNTNIFSYINNNWLATLTIHELIHMLAAKRSSLFLNLFKSELTLFYKNYWESLFSCTDLNEKDIFQLIKWMLLNLEKKQNNTTLLPQYLKLLNNLIQTKSVLDKEELDIRLQEYIILQKTYFLKPQQFFNSYNKYKHLLEPLYHSYKKSFNGKNLTTLCVQELFNPSEVIAIFSEIKANNPKVNKGIKSL